MKKFIFWTSLIVFSFLLGLAQVNRLQISDSLRPTLVIIHERPIFRPQHFVLFEKMTGYKIRALKYNSSEELQVLLKKWKFDILETSDPRTILQSNHITALSQHVDSFLGLVHPDFFFSKLHDLPAVPFAWQVEQGPRPQTLHVHFLLLGDGSEDKATVQRYFEFLNNIGGLDLAVHEGLNTVFKNLERSKLDTSKKASALRLLSFSNLKLEF